MERKMCECDEAKQPPPQKKKKVQGGDEREMRNRKRGTETMIKNRRWMWDIGRKTNT